MVEMRGHQPFKEWCKENLVNILEYAAINHPKELQVILNSYDEWLRGN